MPKLTKDEAKMRAALIVLDLMAAGRAACDPPQNLDRLDWEAVRGEIAAIESWLRGRALGGDKIALRQVNRETGRQAKPTGKLAKQIERLVKKTGGG